MGFFGYKDHIQQLIKTCRVTEIPHHARNGLQQKEQGKIHCDKSINSSWEGGEGPNSPKSEVRGPPKAGWSLKLSSHTPGTGGFNPRSAQQLHALSHGGKNKTKGVFMNHLQCFKWEQEAGIKDLTDLLSLGSSLPTHLLSPRNCRALNSSSCR